MAPAAPAPRWASATSTLPDTPLAVAEVASRLARDLGPGPVDLVLAFFTAAHVRGAERAAELLRERLKPACLLGVSGHGVVSTEHEVEGAPAFTALAARLRSEE